MSESSSLFDASSSAIGYLYQLRYALLAGIEEFQHDATWSVSVEVVDDVEITSADGNTRWQLKHRAGGTRLTNGSTDLWKTLRIWIAAFNDKTLDLETTRLLLLTTSMVPAESAAYYLQDGPGRDIGKASQALDKAAKDSGSDTNKKGVEAYRSLNAGQQTALLKAISVIGDSPDIEGVRQKILMYCRVAVGRAAAESLLNRLEGWFFQRCIEIMLNEAAALVTGTEIDDKFCELRNQFRSDNLPIDEDVAGMTATRDEYDKRLFVRQLDLAGIGGRRIELAVRDYLRACTQRSRWTRESLLLPGEIGAYERRLREEWEAQFAVLEDELGPDAAEAVKLQAAKKIYSWVETEFRRNIRPDCHEPFVCKGSYHILADEKLVGWHPDFEARLLAILEPVGGGAVGGD
nr:hypothetical protein GCM10020063_069920 [Dactylosporangium thailandense]